MRSFFKSFSLISDLSVTLKFLWLCNHHMIWKLFITYVQHVFFLFPSFANLSPQLLSVSLSVPLPYLIHLHVSIPPLSPLLPPTPSTLLHGICAPGWQYSPGRSPAEGSWQHCDSIAGCCSAFMRQICSEHNCSKLQFLFTCRFVDSSYFYKHFVDPVEIIMIIYGLHRCYLVMNNVSI